MYYESMICLVKLKINIFKTSWNLAEVKRNEASMHFSNIYMYTNEKDSICIDNQVRTLNDMYEKYSLTF